VGKTFSSGVFDEQTGRKMGEGYCQTWAAGPKLAYFISKVDKGGRIPQSFVSK
jgi:hypothetical protein